MRAASMGAFEVEGGGRGEKKRKTKKTNTKPPPRSRPMLASFARFQGQPSTGLKSRSSRLEAETVRATVLIRHATSSVLGGCSASNNLNIRNHSVMFPVFQRRTDDVLPRYGVDRSECPPTHEDATSSINRERDADLNDSLSPPQLAEESTRLECIRPKSQWLLMFYLSDITDEDGE